LPFDEPYRIPASTARLIAGARMRGDRIIAIGTSVVRALEHSAAMFDGEAREGERVATQKVTTSSKLRVVDAILSGAHEAGSCRHELLGAFANAEALDRLDVELHAQSFRTHEFGDSVFVEKADSATRATRLAAAS
jgi:S-adenosylmethionine:tRNA ribosyltransferase-isomerase